MSQNYTIGHLPYLVEVDEVERTWTLQRTIRYSLYHLGREADTSTGTGTGSTTSSDIFLDLKNSPIDADYTPQEGKIVLRDGDKVVLPFNVTSVKAVSASGSVAVQIVPNQV